jgi:peptide deformylase
MAILEIITAPDPVLKKKAQPVESVDDNIREIMDNMLETMYHDKGVGLAANQVGILKRIIVMDLQNEDDTERAEGFYPLFMANPTITDCSKEMIEATEACLSVPDQNIVVSRHASVKIKYLDYNNESKELETGGWLARAIQHETDHLEGKLLLDYLSPLKKNVAIRKLTKLKKFFTAN